MSATSIEETFSAEVQFSSFYGVKDFVKDASRLRDLHKLSGREKLSEAERAEVHELRRRLKRADGDAVLVFLLRSRSHGGFTLL
jgi:hypothetical protein